MAIGLSLRESTCLKLLSWNVFIPLIPYRFMIKNQSLSKLMKNQLEVGSCDNQLLSNAISVNGCCIYGVHVKFPRGIWICHLIHTTNLWRWVVSSGWKNGGVPFLAMDIESSFCGKFTWRTSCTGDLNVALFSNGK